ncbi:anti-sigma B factor RsbW [Cohnella nanjingensis]|uniref:Anti-sigma B factor RsbW n=1 Tax=Cohnella nanjingensis TaxID=1387779 RepID=A0A7X0VHE4_9BACL|nr:anti-sigma B factor RsbW [Cohnella nanjingensis]MBB6672549.1 anti-sigma B factor RsbW [Cohnella nanjingensis]
MKNDANVTLSVPAKAEYVDIVRLTLYGIAARMKFSFEEIEDMKVAVSEACNNAVLHAYDQSEPGHVEVVFTVIGDDALQISVSDSGVSFEQATDRTSSNLHGKSIEEIQSGGLGLYLMQALMDQVEIRSNQGTSVILTKRRMAQETV